MSANNRIRYSKQTIIQSTLLKITLSIFIFLIIVTFLYGRNYWEKEGLKINYNLLLHTTNVRSSIELQISDINSLRKDTNLSQDQKEKKLKKIIEPILFNIANDVDNLTIGYYDIESGYIFSNSENISNNFLQYIISTLGTPNQFYKYEWNENNIITVNLPIFDGQTKIGYVWGFAKNNENLFQSTFTVNQISILALTLSILIIFLIRKHIKQIELYLDKFSKMIMDGNYDENLILSKLPELKPVLHKISSFTDELKHMNLELEASNRKTTKILEGISDGFFALDRSYRFTFINSETARLISRTDTKLIVLGKSLLDVFPRVVNSITHVKIEEALKKNEAIHWEAEGFTNSDQYYEYHAYPFKEGLTVFFRDITDLRQQQQELAHLERLNLISQLAAGISHEIRNPLTTVRGFLQFLGTKPRYAQEKEYMDLMISEIDRANLIITDFLSLSKENLDNIKPKNINEIINKVYPLLQADAYNNNKQVFLSLGILPNIMLNENEIKQLVLNLVRNGLEATPEHGSVFISTYQRGDKIMLAIKDHGSGIPAEIQGRIGTPFFTTKDTGTGLGLAISIGIARRHKAEFEFETGSEGTTFYITFPIEENLL